MKKGQIFSLDFLLSIILVLLAIGLLLRTIELAQYDARDERIFSEIKAVAENAANMLVSNPEINCNVQRLEEKIMYCVDTTKINNSNARAMLGITTEFGFSIAGLPSAISLGVQENKDFFEVKRRVLLHSGNITKAEYNTTFRNTATTEVKIRVWKE